MNIKQLEVFLAVAESGSFSKWAAAIFITQSPLGRNYPWSKRRAVALAAVRNDTLLFREAGAGNGQAVLEVLMPSGITKGDLQIKAVLGSIEAIKQAVVRGLGVYLFANVP